MSTPAGLPNQLVQSLLQYRLQVPLVDKMLSELGLSLDKGEILPAISSTPVSSAPVKSTTKTGAN